MSATDQTVEVTLNLPEEVYRRIERAASEEHRPPDDFIRALVIEGLDAHGSVREIMEFVSERYRTRLSREGQPLPSDEETLHDLRALREQIANELYP
jgi:hypothetical protein